MRSLKLTSQARHRLPLFPGTVPLAEARALTASAQCGTPVPPCGYSGKCMLRLAWPGGLRVQREEGQPCSQRAASPQILGEAPSLEWQSASNLAVQEGSGPSGKGGRYKFEDQ